MIPHRKNYIEPGRTSVSKAQMPDGLKVSHVAHGTAEHLKAKLKLPHFTLQYSLATADGVLIILSSLLGNRGYQYFTNGNTLDTEQFFGAGVTAALLYVLIGQSSGFYDLRSIFLVRRRAGRIVAQWFLVALLLTLLAFLLKVGPEFSRGSIVCFASLALVSLLATHRATKRFIVSAVAEGQFQGRRAILIGTREELAALNGQELLQRFGLTEVDRFAFPGDKNKNLAMSSAETSAIEQALAIARERGVDEIVLAFPWNDTRKLELVRDNLRSSPLPVQLLPDRRIRALAENPSFRLKRSLSIEIQRGPLSRVEQMAKRLVDIAGASVALLLMLPLMLVTAVAVKLDSPGPVLFRQRRNGFNAKQFAILKFRTMLVMEDGATLMQAQKSDPRVTRVGRILRRSSIDELPQLLNVLFGHMSLVGPRPHALAHDTHYGDLLSDYAFRHHVKPGITGWAQVRGYRGETSRVEQMKGRIDCDLWYINNWSVALDFRIIALTCFEVVRSRNAY